jgi:hypothetical protein
MVMVMVMVVVVVVLMVRDIITIMVFKILLSW